MKSKNKSVTPQNSRQLITKYLAPHLKRIQDTYGDLSVTVEYTKGSGAWKINGTHRIVMGDDLLGNKNKVLLALIHEMGHFYSKQGKTAYINESNANEWAIECINKLYSDKKILKSLMFRYLLYCLHSGSGEHSQGAKRLLDKLGATIKKVKYLTYPPTLEIILPQAYKNWHPLPLSAIPEYVRKNTF